MYFLFLEFIGTTEVIFIAIVALIIFGPRKMPDIARQIGKTMSDLRRVSTEFRETWEREVALENENSKYLEAKKENYINETNLAELENKALEKNKPENIENNGITYAPTIKEIDASQMNLGNGNSTKLEDKELTNEVEVATVERKRDWL